jgi:hypothetical protein
MTRWEWRPFRANPPSPVQEVEPEPPEPIAESDTSPEPAAAPEPPPNRRVDPQYEPPKEEQQGPISRMLSWG